MIYFGLMLNTIVEIKYNLCAIIMEINDTQYIYIYIYIETTSLFGGVPLLKVKKGERYSF